jgi:hypothetical protein
LSGIGTLRRFGRFSSLFSNVSFFAHCSHHIIAYLQAAMRIRVTIDDDVFEAIRAQSIASGKRLGDVLSQVARAGLRASSEPVNKIPVFDIPAGADIIPSSRGRDLLSKELA